MKMASAAYKKAMNNMIRDLAYITVSVGIITKEAQSSAKVISEGAYFSSTKNIFKSKEVGHTYATLEQNVFKADGSLSFLPENTEDSQFLYDVGYVSKELNDGIRVSFDKPYNIKGLTINFGEYYPTRFKVLVNGLEETIYDNDKEEFTCTDNFNNIEYFDVIPLSFFNGNSKRLRINQMLMGVGIIFNNDDIESTSLTDRVSFTSEELPQMDLSLTVFDRYNRFRVDDSNSFINFLQTGQEITFNYGQTLEDGSVEWVEMPITYLANWNNNKSKVTFTSTDKIALMDGKYEKGNHIHERSLYQEAIDVLEDYGLEPDEYYVDDYLKDIIIKNPLPIQSYANCLQLIANAGRCSLRQSVDGKIILKANFENIIDPLDLVVETSSQAKWSKPQNTRIGTGIAYVDLTENFFSADGSMFFMPEHGENYLETSFVSNEIANGMGKFVNNPNISMILPAAYTYFSFIVAFQGNVPQEFKVLTYNNDVLIDEVIVDKVSQKTFVNHEFLSFNKLKIEITKGCPNNRVLIDSITFGDITDYRLRKEDMFSNVGTVEKKSQSVSVKVFSFTEPEKEGESPKKVEDEVFAKIELNPTGTNVTFENQLIGSKEHAQEVAEWLGNYYANNVSYAVNYRGEPRLDASDIIYMDSDVLNNLQVEIESAVLTYNGKFGGSLNLRRAINMIYDEGE